MTKPIPDKAEVALEYPDKLYIGTFEQSARFDAHLDETGISLSLHRTGADDVRKSIRMHFHYGLFADILRDLAKTSRRRCLDCRLAAPNKGPARRREAPRGGRDRSPGAS